ncbi:MAG: Pls/PosA family non-ribosomal peptide synthetase [Hyphomicrobiaceae bacterium]
MTTPVCGAASRLVGDERHDLLGEDTLATLIRAGACIAPDKAALTLIGTDERITYRELDAASDRMAAALVAAGVGRGDFVGLWCRRSLDLILALVAIAKSGAAFIPFDAEVPVERVASCLADCGARLLVSHEPLSTETAKLHVPVLSVAALSAGTDCAPVGDGPQPDDAAYAIYTSGSTGKPKGIVVTHRNIAHYLKAGNAVIGIRDDDVVLQQASVAFDLSMEEILVPLTVGATLKVASAETVKETDRLAEVIEAEGITVIDTVPTLLSMLERDIAGLRVIVLGGEACPPAIVERFARPGRRLLNTYGPTETTVVATATELRPGEPVTIGRPIPNYTAYVLDEVLRPVAAGTVGELVVGGPGVARGYINLPEMTAAKFVANPFDDADGRDPVLYRTGDAVSVDGKGRLVFHGRIDDQVKVRGYRIELGEIEAVIAGLAGVRTAAVAVTSHPAAGDLLVAHVVADTTGFDQEAARSALAQRLPAYMIPQAWRVTDELPRLASGKLDRKALAQIPLIAALPSAGEQEPPATATEAALVEAAKRVLAMPAVPLEADFFTDLGGQSMIAARFVSEVRKVPGLAGLAMRDVYTHRTLRGMARHLEATGAGVGAKPADLSFEPVPLARRFMCGLAQAITLPFIIAIVTAQWIGLLLASIFLAPEGMPLWQEILLLSGVYVSLTLGAKLFVIALKWILIGRTRPGIYPLWGWYYYRLWLMQRLVQLTSPKFLKGSPLIRIYLRLLGAKVGRDAIIDEFEEGAIDLLTIGPRATIGTKVKLANVEVIGRKVYVGRIDIGADASIGNAAVLSYDVTVGEGAVVGDITGLQAGTHVPPYEHWEGSPARRVGLIDKASEPDYPTIPTWLRWSQALGYFIVHNIALIIGLLPIFPAFYIFYHFEGFVSTEPGYQIPRWLVGVLAWPAALVLIVFAMGVMVALRWLIIPERVQPGRHSIFSWFYFRKWMVGLTTDAILETLNSLYATVFMRNWYRLMGAKVGTGTEISASFAGRYDLIEMGRDNFIGDDCVFGDEEIHRGWMTLERVKTGDRVFFGNNSVVPPGAMIDDDALIGVKSRLPDGGQVAKGETWFGSPAIKFPSRERISLGDKFTYEPPSYLKWVRVVFEAMHTSFPIALMIFSAYIVADIISTPFDNGQWLVSLSILLSAGLVVAALMYPMAVLFKWTLIGTYRRGMHPMWSWWAMRTEAVAVFYGGLASKILLEYLRGTPFLPWLLRPFGTKVGKGCWINSTDICEFDVTSIGDYAVINMGSCPQTHLYEDRIMKVGSIEIGRGVTIGSGATVLYDTKIGEFAQIRPMTLIMKGETIPPHTAWCGAPAQLVGRPTAVSGLGLPKEASRVAAE